jgi:hypothetical protein
MINLGAEYVPVQWIRDVCIVAPVKSGRKGRSKVKPNPIATIDREEKEVPECRKHQHSASGPASLIKVMTD